MIVVRRAGVALTLLSMLLLTGCGGGDPQINPNLREDDAKAIAQAGEMRIVGFIPDDIVASVDQQAKGTLLSCRGDHNYQWSGGTNVNLSGGDVTRIIDDIASSGVKDGWRTQRETAAAGDPRVALYGPDGDVYIVDGLADRHQVGISSGSPCFHLPDGEYPESF